MKLIVQIPCYNEEMTLPAVVADIPRQIDGIDKVEILVLDDGSTDRTVEVAKGLKVDHILQNKTNLGLARTFRIGLEASLKLGADIIVNTDGDNQYAGEDIPKLIQPIIDGKAELVVGNREPSTSNHFSWSKRLLQFVGSKVVSRLSGVNIPDAVSGFRAISKDAAYKINIVSSFSYTTEMIIQAGKKHLAVTSVPIRTNSKTRESRLFKSIPSFIAKQLTTIVRMYAMYQPLRVCILLGTSLILLGLIPMVRFLIYYLIHGHAGNIQSLILGGVFITIGFISYLFGIIADIINFNRQLIEFTLEKVRKIELLYDEKSLDNKNQQD